MRQLLKVKWLLQVKIKRGRELRLNHLCQSRLAALPGANKRNDWIVLKTFAQFAVNMPFDQFFHRFHLCIFNSCC